MERGRPPSGLVIGLIGAIGVLASAPSGKRQLAPDARRKLFLPGEDDSPPSIAA